MAALATPVIQAIHHLGFQGSLRGRAAVVAQEWMVFAYQAVQVFRLITAVLVAVITPVVAVVDLLLETEIQAFLVLRGVLAIRAHPAILAHLHLHLVIHSPVVRRAMAGMEAQAVQAVQVAAGAIVPCGISRVVVDLMDRAVQAVTAEEMEPLLVDQTVTQTVVEGALAFATPERQEGSRQMGLEIVERPELPVEVRAVTYFIVVDKAEDLQQLGRRAVVEGAGRFTTPLLAEQFMPVVAAEAVVGITQLVQMQAILEVLETRPHSIV